VEYVIGGETAFARPGRSPKRGHIRFAVIIEIRGHLTEYFWNYGVAMQSPIAVAVQNDVIRDDIQIAVTSEVRDDQVRN
jgi:hypothetical protein